MFNAAHPSASISGHGHHALAASNVGCPSQSHLALTQNQREYGNLTTRAVPKEVEPEEMQILHWRHSSKMTMMSISRWTRNARTRSCETICQLFSKALNNCGRSHMMTTVILLRRLLRKTSWWLSFARRRGKQSRVGRCSSSFIRSSRASKKAQQGTGTTCARRVEA